MMLPFKRWAVILARRDGALSVYLVDLNLRDVPDKSVEFGRYASSMEAFYQFNLIAGMLELPKVRWG